MEDSTSRRQGRTCWTIILTAYLRKDLTTKEDASTTYATRRRSHRTTAAEEVHVGVLSVRHESTNRFPMIGLVASLAQCLLIGLLTFTLCVGIAFFGAFVTLLD